MSDSLTIKSVFREYTVDFSDDFLATIKERAAEGDFYILDKTITELHPGLLEIAGDSAWIVEAHEDAKSYEGVIPLINLLIEGGFRKNHRLIAVGGGITQDVASYVASLLFRGVDWIFYPTNVLTQCDSCIGSKTSINFRKYKNQLGGFYPPAEVVIDTNLLTTLGDQEISSGMGEMLHYMLVTSEADHQLFLEQAPLMHGSQDAIRTMMRRSLEIKKAMIEIDEFDKGPRNVFNYGHSFGHALESAAGYAIPHGIAVSYGIDLANIVSAHFGLIDIAERNRLRNACQMVFKDTPLPEISMDDYFAAIKKDKKNVGHQLGLILTRGVGDMFKRLCDFDEDLQRIMTDFFKNKSYAGDL